jgi:enoyl-CoA hydratase/carnithine racemase
MAKQLLLSGETIEAKRGYEIGLINYLSSNVLELSLDIASKLKENSQQSLKMTKEMTNRVSELSVDDAVEYCIGLNTISRTTADFKQGLNNFLTKK